MVHETACRSIRITICLLLVCTTLGSAQSGTHTQQNPRCVTVVPAAPTASPTERRVADAMSKAGAKTLDLVSDELLVILMTYKS
jgi:hypothetical protein